MTRFLLLLSSIALSTPSLAEGAGTNDTWKAGAFRWADSGMNATYYIPDAKADSFSVGFTVPESILYEGMPLPSTAFVSCKNGKYVGNGYLQVSGKEAIQKAIKKLIVDFCETHIHFYSDSPYYQ